MSKVIGVLGGMGPYATFSFCQSILTYTNAKKDWEHIHLVIDNNTKIPSRTRCYLYNEESPLSGMINACKKLESYPVDAIALPCNSAQAWILEIQKTLNVQILNIFDATITTVVDYFPRHKEVCVLGGRVTWGMQTYRTYIEKNGLSYYTLDETKQLVVENLIEKIKLNEQKDFVLKELISLMDSISIDHNDMVFVLGCTEFGCVISELENIFPIVDSSTEYAKYVVKYAKGEIA